jgi:uncharacterized damage-inducible protein DinB
MAGTVAPSEVTDLLSRTPAVLTALLGDLPDAWTTANEGAGTWSARDVVGHLIHGERTDWLPRLRIVLEHGDARPFDRFDRQAQFVFARGVPLSTLLVEFASLRAESVRQLQALDLTAADLARQGRHPDLGTVTLGQLLATWVAHDLDHLAQIARVLAHKYSEEVGPWRSYLRIISGRPG